MIAALESVRCPRCRTRLCDRTPNGYAAGHFKCRCKLEVIVEQSALGELELVVIDELTAAVAPYIVRRLPDGRGLISWLDLLAHRGT